MIDNIDNTGEAEYLDDDTLAMDEVNDGDPEVETAEEYGATDDDPPGVEPPPDLAMQNILDGDDHA